MRVWTLRCVDVGEGEREPLQLARLQGKWGSGRQRASAETEGAVAECLVKWLSMGVSLFT